jgi:hypothetical protein
MERSVDLGSGAFEAASVDHVCPTIEERLEQAGNVAGIVFEIGVLNQDPIPSGMFNSTPDRASLSPVGAKINNPQVMRLLELGENGQALIARSIVDEYELSLDRTWRSEKAFRGAPQCRSLIENRHDD